jgi:hypothetical protein
VLLRLQVKSASRNPLVGLFSLFSSGGEGWGGPASFSPWSETPFFLKKIAFFACARALKHLNKSPVETTVGKSINQTNNQSDYGKSTLEITNRRCNR